MLTRRRFVFIVLSAVLFFLSLSPLALAQDNTLKDKADTFKDLDQTKFVGFFNYFAGVFLWLVGIVAFVMILYSAYLFMAGGLDENNIKKAKKFLIYGLVGAVILVLSLSIVSISESLLQ